MMGGTMNENTAVQAGIQSRFAAVFALKSVVLPIRADSSTLKFTEHRYAWDELLAVLPEILAQCSGFTTHSKEADIPFSVMLWDFLNSREICVSVNTRGGYNLHIRADEVSWTETQLPLDLLLLKLLALDYTPEEFRDIAV